MKKGEKNTYVNPLRTQKYYRLDKGAFVIVFLQDGHLG